MSDFQTSREPPKVPYGMVWVGSGVIVSCLVLCVLFGWGIYLDLTTEDCPPQATATAIEAEGTE